MADEDYEILPHREIEDLKMELAKLKEFEVQPSKKIQVTMLELNSKLEKLLAIFEEALHTVKIEGEVGYGDVLKSIDRKLDKLIEQNSDIADGIVAVADMIKGEGEEEEEPEERPIIQPLGPISPPQLPPMPARPMPPLPPRPATPRMPLPPPPRP